MRTFSLFLIGAGVGSAFATGNVFAGVLVSVGVGVDIWNYYFGPQRRL